MFTRLFKRTRTSRTSTSFFGTSSAGRNVSSTGTMYTVTIPGSEPVNLRAANQVEVKRMVREANGLTRLPAGTTVERAN